MAWTRASRSAKNKCVWLVDQGIPANPWPGPGGPNPAQSVGLGANHQEWSESGPESTVWLGNWSRSMPRPVRSVWDRSYPLQGSVPGRKSKKSVPKPCQASAFAVLASGGLRTSHVGPREPESTEGMWPDSQSQYVGLTWGPCLGR